MPPDTVPRVVVLSRLSELIAGARNKDRGVGVLFVRVAGLRRLTMSGGYAAGDRVLNEVFDRLKSTARRGDWFARVGDEDFIFLAPNVTDEGQLILGASRLVRALDGVQQIQSAGVPTSLSVGIAAFPKDGEDCEHLMWAAEVGLGHPSPASMTSEQGVQGPSYSHKWKLESLLSRAVEQGEIYLDYQPKFDLRTGAFAGVEALARWSNHEVGQVGPGIFIPIAEASGLIEDLTWSCINSALQQLSDWRAQNFRTSVAVNLSAICLRALDFAERIRGALTLWNVRAEDLTLEITESAIMNDLDRSFQTLHGLRRLGVRISIDDFGTGHSSFAYFRSLPANELKIDRSFVANLASSEADGHIVGAIIDLAHRFNFLVVAEGIEDPQTAAILRNLHCDIAQGFQFGAPTSADNVFARAIAMECAAHDEPAAILEKRSRA